MYVDIGDGGCSCSDSGGGGGGVLVVTFSTIKSATQTTPPTTKALPLPHEEGVRDACLLEVGVCLDTQF